MWNSAAANLLNNHTLSDKDVMNLTSTSKYLVSDVAVKEQCGVVNVNWKPWKHLRTEKS